MTTRTYGIRIMMIMAFTAVSFFVFAATGGKKTGSKSLTAKKANNYHSFSLRSGFEFKGSKILKLQPGSNSNHVQFNSLALIRKDKVTYSVPYTHKVNVKGSNNQAKYNNVEVKVVKIRI